jgi:hypothetical protein
VSWGGQRHDDPDCLLDDGGGGFDQVQAQGVEPGMPPWGAVGFNEGISGFDELSP